MATSREAVPILALHLDLRLHQYGRKQETADGGSAKAGGQPSRLQAQADERGWLCIQQFTTNKEREGNKRFVRHS